MLEIDLFPFLHLLLCLDDDAGADCPAAAAAAAAAYPAGGLVWLCSDCMCLAALQEHCRCSQPGEQFCAVVPSSAIPILAAQLVAVLLQQASLKCGLTSVFLSRMQQKQGQAGQCLSLGASCW